MNQPLRTPRRLSVSTWALHPLIGSCFPGRPGDPEGRMMDHRDGDLDLLDVPAALAQHGVTTMELCHFHVPDRSASYLATLRAARETAGVELWSLLIDDGDITHPTDGDRDRDWALGWIDTAAQLGARCVRVIAGKQPPTDENLARGVAQMQTLVQAAEARGVHVLTENWFPLLSTPAAVESVLGAMEGAVGLNFDFGNWGGPNKYENLAAVAHWAEGSHAKCDFQNGAPNVDDYVTCLEITKAANYSGPYTLVHGEPNDVWGSLETQRELVSPYL